MASPAAKETGPTNRRRLVWRLATGAALAVLAVTATAHSVGRVTASVNPVVGLTVDPDNGRASAAQADLLIVGSGNKVPWERVERLARTSLTSTPINARAIRQMGMVEEARGRDERALTLVRLANDVSPRELWANIWLVQNCATRDDLDCAMRHFDLAMRGNSGSRQLLFPILLQVLPKPGFRQAMAPFVRNPAPWLEDFVRFAAGTTSVTEIAGALRAAGGLPDDRKYNDLESMVLIELVKQREYAAARDFLSAVDPARRAQLRDASLSPATLDEDIVPLGWVLTSTPRSQALVEAGANADKPVVRVETAPGDFATMAQKILFRTPGRYRFTADITPEAFASAASARWSMVCATKTSERSIWSAEVDPARPTVVDFAIDTTCPTQILRLVASGGDGNDGAVFIVNRVSVAPLP